MASSKVDEALDDLIAQGHDRIDAYLELIAGIAAGLRTDGNALRALPAPWPLERVEEFATLLPHHIDLLGSDQVL